MDEPEAEASPTKEEREATLGAEASYSAGPAKAAPWVADPKALERVGTAAKAIGLSVEELANLIVDAGITALPPSDGITTKYTLKELGVRLWGAMQEEPRHMRAKWFAGLAPHQQAAVIVVLRDRGFSTAVVSQEFKIEQMEVIRTWNKHADDLGAQVVGTRLNTIAGNLQIMAERAQHGAMEKGDHATMWRIQKELTKVLQDLGIVDRAVHRVNVSHTFDAQKKVELEGLLELERKQARRAEEVKLIEAEVTDEIPEEVEDEGIVSGGPAAL